MKVDPNKLHLLLGKVILAFDSHLWYKADGDIGDNSCFYRLAEIIGTNRDGDVVTVDVCFQDETYRISRGHLLHGLKMSKNLQDAISVV
jgi:hypothetical protein